MEPFIHDKRYPFIFCQECQWACIAKEVNAHLARNHPSIQASTRRAIRTAVESIDGLIQDQAELASYTLPDRITPISHLQPPKRDGFRCHACPYVTRDIHAIREHCKAHHGWVSDWTKGGNIKKKKQKQRHLPWEEGVWCQRLFHTRTASSWFEVVHEGTEGEEQNNSNRSSQEPSHQQTSDIEQEEMLGILDKWENAQTGRYEDGQVMRRVEELDPKNEANSWLNRVGWTRHLEGLDVDGLRQLAAEPDKDDVVLQCMTEQCRNMLDEAYQMCRSYRIGLPSMFEINRREVGVAAKRPFEPRMEADSWGRYKGVICRIIWIIHRAEQQPQDERPPYNMTKRQDASWQQFRTACIRYREAQDQEAGLEADNGREHWGNNSGKDSSSHSSDNDGAIRDWTQQRRQECQNTCRQFIVAMLDHRLGDHQYDNMLISALAVMGMRDDGGWHSALDYTPVLSAVIKVARIVVLYDVYIKRQAEIRNIVRVQGVTASEARQSGMSMFERTRQCVRSFMTRTGHNDGEFPSPMDWILETRTYGMKIRFTTTAGGTIDWINDQVIFRRMRLTMTELSEFMHSVLHEARQMMNELTMVRSDSSEASILPTIVWDDVYDDNSNDQVGYTFIKDDRNRSWVADGKGFINKQLVKNKRERQAWFRNTNIPNNSTSQPAAHPFREHKARQYGRLVDQFREKLLILMHMASGQPARATEILTIRFENTANAGTRNIMVSHGQMCFVTAYHKNFQQSDQVKIVHRFMPPEVGELLMWYIWLVLPFWQSVQGTIKRSTFRSAYVWADEITSRSAVANRQDEEEGVRSSNNVLESSSPGEQDMQAFRETKWSSDRVRRIMQQNSKRLLGQTLSTSSWRQIAIAISNRYLGTKYDPAYNGENGEDEDNIDDVSNARDLQAGHTSHVAGMIYAREMQQGLGGTAMMREKFREVSREWHQFFNFGQDGLHRSSVRGSATAATHQRVQRNKFESSRQHVRLQRLQALRQADISAALAAIKGSGAQFRPGQRRIIQAIVRGESPVVQITPTGGGKSMSFMLPAMCSREGKTIVIVPLVALQEDICEECIKHGIEASMWNSKGVVNQRSRVIIVITEAVFTTAFRAFIQRLQNQFAIDRVVVDECHTMLDGSDTFRPALRDVGREIAGWGVQRVFLTATLRPTEESEFLRRACIQKERMVMFRGSTTRRNIEYSVKVVEAEEEASDRWMRQQEVEEEAAATMAQAWIEENNEGRVIIYGGTIPRTKSLAEELGVDAYYNKAGDREEKRRRMQGWMTTKRLIVATNALGLGINVPDVRLVIHVGLPYEIRAFAQESGRLGRDGKRGQSVVICGKVDGQKSFTQAQQSKRDAEMVEYARGTRCRRFILDKAMDGVERESGCKPIEEMCDVCIRGDGGMGRTERHVMAIRSIIEADESRKMEENRGWETIEREGSSGSDVEERDDHRRKKRRTEEGSNHTETGTPGRAVWQREHQRQQQEIDEWTLTPREDTDEDRDDEEEIQTSRGAILGRTVQEMEGENVASGSNALALQIYMQDREAEFAMWKESETIRNDAALADEFERQLASWDEYCVWCRMMADTDMHTKDKCPIAGKGEEKMKMIKRDITSVKRWMERKGSFGEYSGCWWCGLPYKVCDRWEEVGGDGGRFYSKQDGKCQYPNVMAEVVGTAMSQAGDILEYVLKGKEGEGQGMASISKEEMMRVGGKRRAEWGGMETNEMCVAMSKVMDWFESGE